MCVLLERTGLTGRRLAQTGRGVQTLVHRGDWQEHLPRPPLRRRQAPRPFAAAWSSPPSLPLALKQTSKPPKYVTRVRERVSVLLSLSHRQRTTQLHSCTARLATTSSLPGSISVPSTVTLTSHGGSHTVGLYVPCHWICLLLACTALMHFSRSHLQGHRGLQRGSRIRASPGLHTV